MRGFQDLAAFFQDKATGAYERSPDGYIAKARYQVRHDSKPFSTLRDHFQHIDHGHVAAIHQALDAVDLNEFSYVAEGSTAVCFVSNNDRVIRLGPVPSQSPPEWYEYDYVRHHCPLILQADRRWLVQGAYMQVEELTFGAMLNDDDIPDDFSAMLRQVLDGTCFKLASFLKDLAVLPDGTPIYVDPGAINLRDWARQPTQADFDKIAENTTKLGLPEPLSWILPDGRFKQELFFPAPKTGRMDLVI